MTLPHAAPPSCPHSTTHTNPPRSLRRCDTATGCTIIEPPLNYERHSTPPRPGTSSSAAAAALPSAPFADAAYTATQNQFTWHGIVSTGEGEIPVGPNGPLVVGVFVPILSSSNIRVGVLSLCRLTPPGAIDAVAAASVLRFSASQVGWLCEPMWRMPDANDSLFV